MEENAVAVCSEVFIPSKGRPHFDAPVILQSALEQNDGRTRCFSIATYRCSRSLRILSQVSLSDLPYYPTCREDLLPKSSLANARFHRLGRLMDKLSSPRPCLLRSSRHLRNQPTLTGSATQTPVLVGKLNKNGLPLFVTESLLHAQY